MMIPWSKAIETTRPDRSKSGIKISDYPKFMEELEVVKKNFWSIENLHRTNVQLQLLQCCKIASEFRRSADEWLQFIGMNWGELRKPKFQDRQRALRHVLRWVCGSSKEGQQKASFYYRALGPLLEKGENLDEIRSKLEEQGLRKLASSHSRNAHLDKIATQVVKKGKRWFFPNEIYFDVEPSDFPELSAHVPIKLEGMVVEVGKRTKILAFKISTP